MAKSGKEWREQFSQHRYTLQELLDAADSLAELRLEVAPALVKAEHAIDPELRQEGVGQIEHRLTAAPTPAGRHPDTGRIMPEFALQLVLEALREMEEKLLGAGESLAGAAPQPRRPPGRSRKRRP
jgi:hypothetical protein